MNEIRTLIEKAIAGQGNQIDAGGVLAKILKSVVPVEVADITKIDGAILDELQPGQAVIKITGNQKHTYIVSYKGEGVGQGICLTYTDASLIETHSYDFTADGWVYNSKDEWAKA